MLDKHAGQYVHDWQGSTEAPNAMDRGANVHSAGVGRQYHYSLNDACRIHAMTECPSKAIKCPACGQQFGGVAGGSGEHKVLLLVCCGCGRQLVLTDSM